MKEIQKFICEKCLKEYETTTDAMQCEKGHWEIEEIVQENYYGSSIEERQKPFAIKVKFKNGESITYTNHFINDATIAKAMLGK